MSEVDGIEALTEAIGRYNEAWNAKDLRRLYDSVGILRQVGLLD